ncbi:MAG: YciI family protein [Rhodospirillales bacterium]|nr:YciI family protein [Rhodospirillales bacterium]
MLFALICTDRPGGLELRLATRPQHLAFLETYAAKLVHAGAMLDPEGRPCGSLLVIDVADRAEAEGFAEADPYAKVRLFESTIIRPFRAAYRDGERV